MRPPRSRRRVLAAVMLAVVVLAGIVAGCQATRPDAEHAVLTVAAPPWNAPVDASAYIDAAGLERLPFDFRGPMPYSLTLSVTVDGRPVPVPSNIGVDRARAEEAPIHTHAADGSVHVEARSADDRPTLQQFFTLWGVRYDAGCLGDACGDISVTVDGTPAAWNAALQPGSRVEVTARHD